MRAEDEHARYSTTLGSVHIPHPARGFSRDAGHRCGSSRLRGRPAGR
jgi:hypothetical protein